jgi:hypothetical protein
MTPRYVRFAQALALVSASGCYLQHGLPEDAAPDAARADGDIDASITCTEPGCECRALACECPRLGDRGTCADALLHCCPVVGPLAPPELT